MKKPKELPNEVKVILEAIKADVFQLHSRWRAFNEIYADNDAVALLNDTAPRFFAFVYDAALTDIIVAIVRKTDERRIAGKDTLGFKQLAHVLENHGFKMLAKRINSRVAKLRPKSIKEFVKRRDPLTFYRNNKGGHTNLQIRTDPKSKPLPDLKIDKFETALKLFREMLDFTDEAFGINSPRYEDLNLDAGRLLVSLRTAKLALESPHMTDIMLEARHAGA